MSPRNPGTHRPADLAVSSLTRHPLTRHIGRARDAAGAEIDRLVYGLTEEEIAIVEEGTGS